MSYEMPCFFKFIHALFEPLLRWNYNLKMTPIGDYYLSKMSELNKSKQVGFLSF